MGFGKAATFRDTKDFENISTSLPKPLAEKLRLMAREANMPVSKFIMFAVANELEQSTPFRFDVPWPTDEFVEDAHVDTARKIMRFLANYDNGMPADTLIMFHETMGIESREEVMRGLRELVEKELVIEFFNTMSKFKNYRRDYYYYRVTTPEDRRKLQRKRDAEAETKKFLQRTADGEDVT